MKKFLIYALGLIILVVAILPFITGNLEKEVLSSEARGGLEGSFIELSDGYTHYELKGERDAKTIVLVHGNAAPYFTWDYNFDELVEAGYRVLRYDIYGHGYSDRPDLEVFNRDLYDRQLFELMEKLEIEYPVYLVGTSQGGSISAYFAAKHPEKVEKIAFLAPLFDSISGASRVELLKKKFIGEYLMSLMGDKVITDLSNVLYSDEKKEELAKKLEKQTYYKGKKRAVLANIRGNALDDATPYYEQIKEQGIPVLLTWGENDRSISLDSMERLLELMEIVGH